MQSNGDFALPAGFTSWDGSLTGLWAFFFTRFLAPQKVPGLPAGANLRA